MAHVQAELGTAATPGDDVSFLALGSALLKRRKLIIALAVLGGTLGLVSGLMSRRVYKSSATFVPQSTETPASGLALAASQFGIDIPNAGNQTWGPPLYVELLGSRGLLESLAKDTIAVAEQGGRRMTIADLLGAKEPLTPERLDATVRMLQHMVNAEDVKPLHAVKLTVTSRWPSVSKQMADLLVQGVNDFNLKTRKSQASAEREFVDNQTNEAQQALSAAEDRLRQFMLQNRAISNPDLELEQGRLQRDVAIQQQVYTSLVQNREQARIREVRDTPVITVVEAPEVPVSGEARKSVQKALMGGVAGALLAMLFALIAQRWEVARNEPRDDVQEFLRAVDDATPRILRRSR